MKKTRLFFVALATALIGAALFRPQNVYADCAGAETSIINCSDSGDASEGINTILRIILTVLTYGSVSLAVLGVIIVGIMYLTARDSTEQVAKAKKRILEIAIGLILFAGLGTITNWLVPGGILLNFNNAANGGNVSNNGGNNGNGGSNGNNGGNNNGSNGGNGSNNANQGESGSDPSASDPAASTPVGNRQSGSESMEGVSGDVGSGSEGWLETN